jgi:hypothetical protein
MTTLDSIQQAYIDYVLTEGHQPASVYIFAKNNGFTEAEFYQLFGSFEAVEQSIWAGFGATTLTEVQAQEIWPQYTAREKALSFFYAFFELLKGSRSFAVYSLEKHARPIGMPAVLERLKAFFENFADSILKQGLESGELSDRKFFAKRYKDGLWMQFGFVLNFWLKDNSANFEKTDEAIEKGINVTFDLFERTPIDNLIDYGKFLYQNSSIKEKMGF